MAEPVTVVLLVTAGAAVVGGVMGALAGRAQAKDRQARAEKQGSRHEAERIRVDAEEAARSSVREAEIAAREEALAARAALETELQLREEELGRTATKLVERETDAVARAKELVERRARLSEREAPLLALDAEASRARAEAKASLAARRAALEKLVGESANDVRRGLVESEIETARAVAAQTQRAVEQTVADPEHARNAHRLMGISVGRFTGHYLTERHQSVIPLVDARQNRLTIPEADLAAISTAAGVRLVLTDTEDAVRLEGLDGVGREVARRCLARLFRRPGQTGEAVARIGREVFTEVEREVLDFGRRAFAVLEIPRAHPEIVKLVGRLNWRTSFTQNQWKHAIESAFLCGMMAEEMGLDVKVARRAALMHDIGKALTHELDGSHAVIGADYARRLGETEMVANAIGAHHTDEPFNSPYAYLVAASDAMSGGRPGARRQTEDNYVAKIADLERITRGFPGVAESFAVQGGREVRVVVKDDRVDDMGAVTLSSQIAGRISEEMTFPGQIRVTVIREFKAIETAN